VRLAHALGKSRLAIVESEAGEYGPRFIEHVQGTARELGVEIVEHTMATLDESSAGTIAEGVVASNADAVTIVGILDRGTAALIRELRQRLGQDFPIITPDGFMLPEELDALAGPAAQGVYSTVYGIPNGELPKRGRDFVAEYERSRGTPIGADLGAVYGGQAAEVLLDAIGVSDGTRASVTREVMKTDEPDGLIGAIAFDEFGELEEPPVTIMRFSGDDFELDRVVKTKNVSPTS
jgi:branched-chain amino acid transport system substrate-binding protein